MTDGSPAHSHESEQIVLGAMMLQPAMVPDITEIVTAGDFYGSTHATIFAAITANHSSGDPVDAVAVAVTLERSGDLKRIGGAPYLHTLVSAVPTVSSAAWHARRVAELHYARRAEEAGIKLAQIARTGDREAIGRQLGLIQEQAAGDAPAAENPAPQKSSATPFVAGHGYARRFPVEHLPRLVRDYACDLAERKQVPVDLPALFILGIASGIIGPRFLIRRDRDWTEPTNLYVIAGLRSGSAKSPVVKELTRGLGKAKALLAERHTQAIAEQQEQLNTEIEERLEALKDVTLGFEEKAGKKAQLKDLQREAEQLAQKPPRPPLTVVDGDTTPEALAERMSANGGYVSVVDDEGPLLRNLGGQYSGKTANLAILLKAYDGQPYYPSRITRDASMMDRATLAITISPQPGLVAEMLRNTLMDETGLINRFLLSLPGDLIGKREDRPSTFVDDVPDREDITLRLWWSDILEALAGYDLLTGDPEHDDAGTLDLTRGAWKLHLEYATTFEPRMDADRGGDLARIVGWASKHCGRILRIATGLHLLSGATPDDRVEESTMRSAIAIGEWALDHFLHLGKVVGLSENASRIKEYILGKDAPWASRTEINVEVFRKAVHGDQLTAWIDELIESGEFELRKSSGRGRPTEFVCKAGCWAGGQRAA